MPADSVFVDTNVLLYAFDARAPIKRALAREWVALLWESGRGRLSWQVLHEFYANAVRKTGVPPEPAREAVTAFSRWRPVDVTFGLIERAWYWMDTAQLSYWDSLILGSAERLGCRWLLSEDFQSGRDYEGVTAVNPFKTLPSELGLSRR